MSGYLTVSLALVSLISIVAYFGVFVAWHILPTGYNPVRHAVSDYAVGKYGQLFRIGLWLSSLGVLALALALIVGVGAPPLAVRDAVYLLLIPLTRIGMTMFPTSLEGQRFTRTAAIHYLFAIAAFTFTYLAISGTTPTLPVENPPTWLDAALRWTTAAVAPELILVVISMIGPLRRVFGLFERLFLVTTNIWFVLVAVLLIRRQS